MVVTLVDVAGNRQRLVSSLVFGVLANSSGVTNNLSIITIAFDM